ncbi:MAG: hypothetical protein EA422_10015 [Gemmatimonadales bacterium]|nr:MAG: hypothetical protein EA422_10015 [Gemmatimonadales bacterium]
MNRRHGVKKKGGLGFPILILLALVGCDGGFFVDPPAQGTVSLELRIPPITSSSVPGPSPASGGNPQAAASAATATAGEGPAAVGAVQAFGRVDRVAVRVTSQGQTLLDEVVSAAPSGGEITLSFQFELEEVRADAQVEVELRAGDQGLFGGEGSAELERGRTARAEIGLSPIPSGIRIPAPPEPVEALGDTIFLEGAVVFASGDTIPGLEVEWRSNAPEIVTVSRQGVAVAVGEGEADLEASFADFVETLTIRVAPVVVDVEVSPDEAEVDPGDTVQFTAETLDRRGNILVGRDVAWTSTDERVATVDAQGRVETLRPGEIEVVAVSEQGEGRATLVVRQVRPVLATLPAEDVEADRATLVGEVNPRGSATEVRFRWGTSPTLQGAALTAPIDVSDGLNPVRVEAELEELQPFTTYYFRVEASSGAGVSNGTIQSFTTLNPVPAPTALEGTFGDGVVTLGWSFDGGDFTEVLFEVERRVDEPEGEGGTTGEWITIGTSAEQTFVDLEPVPGATALYRVRACVEDICSPWSEPASVEVPEAEPAMVSGTVRLDGDPLSGIQVRLSGSALDEPRTTVSLPGGSYAFEDVEAGRYVVEVIPSSLELEDEWFPSRRVEITVFGFGETITVNFDGVSPPPTPESLSAEWRGTLQVEWQPGQGTPAGTTYELQRGLIVDFSIPSWETAGSTSGLNLQDDPEPAAETWAYRVRACAQQACSPYSDPDSTWVPRTAIWGFVTDQSGNPVSGVFLSIQRIDEEAPFIFGQSTDSDGFFTWSDRFYSGDLPNEEDQGPWTFIIESSSDQVFGEVEVSFGETTRIDLQTGFLPLQTSEGERGPSTNLDTGIPADSGPHPPEEILGYPVDHPRPAAGGDPGG